MKTARNYNIQYWKRDQLNDIQIIPILCERNSTADLDVAPRSYSYAQR